MPLAENAGSALDMLVLSSRVSPHLRDAVAKVEAERIMLRWWVEWVCHVKDDDCSYDHHGYCQSHNLDEYPCPVSQMKAYLWPELAAETGGNSQP